MSADGGSNEVTLALGRIRAGDSSAYESLVPLVYSELRAIAGRFMRDQRAGHTLQPTALVHEAMLRLIHDPNPAWEDRTQFLSVAAGCMRRVLVDHARVKGAEKRGGDLHRVTLSEELSPGGDSEVDVLALHQALERLAELDARQARVVELRYFGGLTLKEIAELLEVALSTVKLDWKLARGWLFRELSGER